MRRAWPHASVRGVSARPHARVLSSARPSLVQGSEDPLIQLFRSDRAVQSIRACPLPAGGALVFSHRVMHWGSRGHAGCTTPRFSLSLGCSHAPQAERSAGLGAHSAPRALLGLAGGYGLATTAPRPTYPPPKPRHGRRRRAAAPSPPSLRHLRRLQPRPPPSPRHSRRAAVRHESFEKPYLRAPSEHLPFPRPKVRAALAAAQLINYHERFDFGGELLSLLGTAARSER